jgi:citrate lyase subunit beta/citryl-CoA lyase
VAWARRVIAAAQETNGGVAVQLDGTMIDAPVITRARQILVRSETTA